VRRPYGDIWCDDWANVIVQQAHPVGTATIEIDWPMPWLMTA